MNKIIYFETIIPTIVPELRGISSDSLAGYYLRGRRSIDLQFVAIVLSYLVRLADLKPLDATIVLVAGDKYPKKMGGIIFMGA